MKRYTQGFKYFGPLEQSNDGSWIKFEDHQHQLKIEIDTAFKLMNEQQQDQEELNNQIIFLNQTIESLEKQLFEKIGIAAVASALVVVESIYFLIKSA